MTVNIKLAERTEEIEGVFRLRHQVMAEEEGYLDASLDGRFFDRFDAYPTTGNVIAVVGNEVVGAIRFIEESAAGTTAEEFFDFRPFLPPGARPAASSMLVVAREYRKIPRLVFALNGMGYYWAISRGITHILAPANPERRGPFEAVGHRVVAPEFLHERKKLPVLPMILELAELRDRFLAFVQRQRLTGWLDTFHRQFHAAGEVIVRKGEPGEFAFVVIEGRAVVSDTVHGREEVLAEVGPGELFGETALLVSGPRTATVVAATDVDLMVLNREDLRRALRRDPDFAESLLRLLAERLANLQRR